MFDPWPNLVHGVFTRVSSMDGRRLNLAFGEHDREENVRANLDLTAQALGLERLAFVRQIHGDRSMVIRTDQDYRPRRPGENA